MSKATKVPLILFFILGNVATKEDIQTGGSIPHATVQYRNALQVHKDDALEPCDGVYGAVPDSYKKLPSAEEAVKAYLKRLESVKKASGDDEAPKTTKDAKDLPPLADAKKKTGKKSSKSAE